MKCEFCGSEPPQMLMLIPVRMPDGALCAFACSACARGKKVFCDEHLRPHIGFADGTHACLFCIEARVTSYADDPGPMIRSILNHLQSEDARRLRDWANFVARIRGEDWRIAVLRAIVTKAERTGTTVEDVVGEIVRTSDLNVILPESLLLV